MVVRVLIKFLPPRCHRNYGIENLGGAGREGAEEARVVQPHLSVKGLRRLSLLLFPSGGLLLFLLVSRLNFFSLLFSTFLYFERVRIRKGEQREDLTCWHVRKISYQNDGTKKNVCFSEEILPLMGTGFDA